MEHYYLTFGDAHKIVSREQLSNFISNAVYHNHDIQKFTVIALDNRLSQLDAIKIASKFNLADEVIMNIEKGDSPLNALMDWIK